MDGEALLAMFQRMVGGDEGATTALADYLARRADEARAGNRVAADELQTLAYRVVEERVRTLMRSERYLAARGHSAASVIHEAWMRILKRPEAPPDLRALCLQVAGMVRHALSDIATKQRRWDKTHHVPDPQPLLASGERGQPLSQTAGSVEEAPHALAVWAEFHARAATLPEDEREVFDLRYYGGLSREATAGQLGVSEYYVDGRWLRAIDRLRNYLPPGP